jgi:hypothetical protein
VSQRLLYKSDGKFAFCPLQRTVVDRPLRGDLSKPDTPVLQAPILAFGWPGSMSLLFTDHHMTAAAVMIAAKNKTGK